MVIDTSLPCGIILAAGGSKRMGHPKGLLTLGGRPLIRHHIDALENYSRSIFVVLGANHDDYEEALPSCVTVIRNRNWATTDQVDSLRLVLEHIPVHHRAWLVPVDTAPASAQTLRGLLETSGSVVPLNQAGQPGHPALIGSDILVHLRQHIPTDGVRGLLADATRLQTDDPYVACNFNRPHDWETFRNAFVTD